MAIKDPGDHCFTGGTRVMVTVGAATATCCCCCWTSSRTTLSSWFSCSVYSDTSDHLLSHASSPDQPGHLDRRSPQTFWLWFSRPSSEEPTGSVWKGEATWTNQTEAVQHSASSRPSSSLNCLKFLKVLPVSVTALELHRKCTGSLPAGSVEMWNWS